MAKLLSFASAVAWIIPAIVLGLLPLWVPYLGQVSGTGVHLSPAEILKSGGIVIFSITLTCGMMMNYFMSPHRYSSRLMNAILNLFVPMLIVAVGIAIHIYTLQSTDDDLAVDAIFRVNIALLAVAVCLCVAEKAYLLHQDRQNAHERRYP